MQQSKSAMFNGLGIEHSPRAPISPPRNDAGRSRRTLRAKASAPDLRHRPSDKPPRRPTYKRDGGPHGYSSFSVLEPPGAPSSSVIHGLPNAREQESKRRTDTSSLASTGSSIGSQLRKVKSAELFRKFGKTAELGGAPYVPLSGADDDDPGSNYAAPVIFQISSQILSGFADQRNAQMDSPSTQAGSTTTRDTQHSGSSYSSHVRTLSSRPLPREPMAANSHTGLSPRSSSRRSTITQRSFEKDPSRFPLPPIRTDTTSSDPMEKITPPDAMSRSLSSPGPNAQPARPLFSYPDGLDNRPEAVRPESRHNKRLSNVSTGVHSKNAVILSAESGGLMLEYSPGGKWKEGQMICGPAMGLFGTTDNISDAAMDDVDDLLMDQGRSISHERTSSRLSQVNIHTQSGYLRHTKSHSENDAFLARHGTLLHPASSHDRTSHELGIMLGKKNRKTSRDKLLPAPENAWENNAAETVGLEASKKKRARVEVDVVLERDCVVEGGEVRGRLEVRVNGTKRSEGLRIGGGKIRVVGFEGWWIRLSELRVRSDVAS